LRTFRYKTFKNEIKNTTFKLRTLDLHHIFSEYPLDVFIPGPPQNVNW